MRLARRRLRGSWLRCRCGALACGCLPRGSGARGSAGGLGWHACGCLRLAQGLACGWFGSEARRAPLVRASAR
eukprot:2721065-Heterocapsa_arctica.AAC.1